MHIFREEGIRGMYRGYQITAICTPLFHMMYLPLYEVMKGEIQRRTAWDQNSFALYASAAALSGAICNCISNPFWMVRTRMQAEIFRSMSKENYQRKYPLNLFKAMRII